MKNANIIGIIVLLSMMLAVSGCGDKEDEPQPVPAEELDDTDEGDASDEPELPDDAPQDIGTDITEDELSPDDEDAPAEEEAAEEEAASDEEGEDAGDDEEAQTAQNFRVISLKDLKAYPEEMEVNVGTTVEWRNVNDNLLHIIGWRNQKNMGVTPEPIKAGESWSYTFNEPGEIKWFSTARPTIQGTIIIKE